MKVVYYSTGSGNTHRFTQGLGLPTLRITSAESLKVAEPYVLVTPTLSGGQGRTPSAVIDFLRDKNNRDLCRGVIGVGDRNFGKFYCRAAHAVAQKLNVPLLYTLEMFGTPEDTTKVRNILGALTEQTG